MCPSTSIFAYGFNMMVLQHITDVKCVNGCPKIILHAALVVDMKLQFPGLHIHLTWILSICPVLISDNQGPCQHNQY
jgi:hypothetical protein